MNKITAVIIAAALAAAPSFADDGHRHSAEESSHASGEVHHDSMHAKESPTSRPAAAAANKRVGDPWPLDTCIVSGEKLGSMGDPITQIHNGREVKFCCKGCIKDFTSDPDKYLARADEIIIEQQKALYPIDYCIIDTAEKLEADEAENDYAVVGNRLFVYCCAICDDDVRSDVEKYIGILNKAAIEKQSPDYPISTCVVSGDPLGGDMGEPIDHIFNGRLVRLCCKGCIKSFDKNPAEYMAKITVPQTAEMHEASGTEGHSEHHGGEHKSH